MYTTFSVTAKLSLILNGKFSTVHQRCAQYKIMPPLSKWRKNKNYMKHVRFPKALPEHLTFEWKECACAKVEWINQSTSNEIASRKFVHLLWAFHRKSFYFDISLRRCGIFILLYFQSHKKHMHCFIFVHELFWIAVSSTLDVYF